MRIALLPIFIALGCVAFTGRSEGTLCVLRFLNGDALHGDFHRITPKGVEFTSSAISEKVLFKLQRLSEIDIIKLKKGRLTAAVPPLFVIFKNGDALGGEKVSFEDSIVHLTTRFSDDIPIPAKLLHSMHFKRASLAIFDGFKTTSAWSINRRGSRSGCAIKDDTLLVKGRVYLSGKFKLPDFTRVDFDVPTNASIHLFFNPESSERYPSRCYGLCLDLNSEEVNFFRMLNGNIRQVGKGVSDLSRCLTPLDQEVRYGENGCKRPIHATVLIDKSKGALTLMLNYNIVMKCSKLENISGKGAGFAMLMQQSGELCKMKNFVVRSWSADEPVVDPSKNKYLDIASEKYDLIKLTNKDRISGNLMSIAAGMARFKSKYAELNVPIADFEDIVFAGVPQRLEANSIGGERIRAIFADGGRITTSFASIDPDKFTCAGNFKGVTLPSSILTRIEFNLGSRKQVRDGKTKSFFAMITSDKIKTHDDSNDEDEDEDNFFDSF